MTVPGSSRLNYRPRGSSRLNYPNSCLDRPGPGSSWVSKSKELKEGDIAGTVFSQSFPSCSDRLSLHQIMGALGLI